MEKAIFTDKIFYSGLIGFISILLLYNVYSIMSNFELRLIMSIIIQIILLILIFNNHKLIKLLLKIWSAIFFIIAFGLMILGGLLKDLANTFEDFDFLQYIKYLIFLCAGIIIYIGAEKTIFINKVEADSSEIL